MPRGIAAVLLLLCGAGVRVADAQMDPYFGAINYPVSKGTLMLAALPDVQVARFGANFFTAMAMAQYGMTSRWSVGLMVEGQKIPGLPLTYGGLRLNTYLRVFPNDHELNFTLYGEYEGLNEAALYKMEVAGFGAADLSGPLAEARSTPARTFEQRAIVYHDWGRLNGTFNFVSETGLDSGGNAFGYAWGLFWRAEWTGMEMAGGSGAIAMRDPAPAGTGASAPSRMSTPPALSLTRLGLGLEMMGGLGDTHRFGLHWSEQQQYLGAVFRYTMLPQWGVRIEPLLGLSGVSDHVVLRIGVDHAVDGLFKR